MLYVFAGILLLLWFAGLVMSYTLDGFIHLFIVGAIVLVLINLVRGERRS